MQKFFLPSIRVYRLHDISTRKREAMSEAKTHEIPRDQPDHPSRCQSNSHSRGNRWSGDQCWNYAAEGSKFCVAHGGTAGAKAAVEKRISLYQITQFQARIDEMTQAGEDPNSVLGLRSEIGLLRMKLEKIFGECKSSADLIIHSQKINMTVQLIGKLIVDAKKLESSLGQLLDKQAITSLCDKIIAILDDEVKDPAILERVAGRIGAAVESITIKRLEEDEK